MSIQHTAPVSAATVAPLLPYTGTPLWWPAMLGVAFVLLGIYCWAKPE